MSSVCKDCHQVDDIANQFLDAENEQQIVAALTEMLKWQPISCPIPVIEKLFQCLKYDREDITNLSLTVLTVTVDHCDVDWTSLLTDTAMFIDLVDRGNPGVVPFLLKVAPLCPSFLSKVFSVVTVDEAMTLCQTSPNLASLIEILSFCPLQHDSAIELITRSFTANPVFLPAAVRALVRLLEDESLLPDLLQINFDSVIRNLVLESQSVDEEMLCDLLRVCLIFSHHCVECVTVPCLVEIVQTHSPRVSGMALMVMSEMMQTEPERYMPQFRECHTIRLLCNSIKESSADERRRSAYALAVLMNNATSGDFEVMLENITFADLFEIFELDDICTTVFVMNIVKLSFRFMSIESIPIETVHHVLNVLEAMSDNPDPDVAGFAAALALDIDEAFDPETSDAL